jgi:hypothetical protein
MSLCISHRVSCGYRIITYALIAPALRPLWRSYDLADWRRPQ